MQELKVVWGGQDSGKEGWGDGRGLITHVQKCHLYPKGKAEKFEQERKCYLFI